MPLGQVVAYRAAWKWYAQEGRIYLKPQNGNFFGLVVKDPMQFSVMVDLLRNEKPIYWDAQNQTLTTSSEPIGEEET